MSGGIAFAASAALSAGAVGFWTLLAALVLGNPATGAFVSLAQATLMDLDPDDRERNMARWTLAGSFGYVGGPAIVVAAVWIGIGWRGATLALAVAALPLVVAMRRAPQPSAAHATGRAGAAGVVAALRDRNVLRWLAVLEAADLLGDVFHAFLALYLVDVLGRTPSEAALGVAVWTGAGLLGNWALLVVLRRVDGLRFLRATAVTALMIYPAFLVVPGIGGKLALVAALGLLNAGWYAIPQARLYESLPGRSGAAVAVGGIGGLAGAVVPAALGAAAGALGLGTTMWALVLAPVTLLALVPRRQSASGTSSASAPSSVGSGTGESSSSSLRSSSGGSPPGSS